MVCIELECECRNVVRDAADVLTGKVVRSERCCIWKAAQVETVHSTLRDAARVRAPIVEENRKRCAVVFGDSNKGWFVGCRRGRKGAGVRRWESEVRGGRRRNSIVVRKVGPDAVEDGEESSTR